MTELTSLIHELEDAIASGTAGKRVKALKLVTDLFITGSGSYSHDQIALFDDVLVRLANAIEKEARAKLAYDLATLADAPARTVRSLAFDDSIDVAGPVLMWSAQLAEADLVANATTKSQDHLNAIAQRGALTEAVTDILVERGETRVVHSVAKNKGAQFSDTGFGKLVARADCDETLAQYVATREDLPRHHFIKLLETASATVRARLEAANPAMANAVRDAVADVADNINLEVRNESREHNRAKARVKRLHKTSQFSEADLHQFARTQNFEQTVVSLSVLGSFPIELVERALLDKNPGLILILAKAARCCWATTKALLLMSAADRGMSVMDLDESLATFERMKLETAKQAMAFYSLRRLTPIGETVPAAVMARSA